MKISNSQIMSWQKCEKRFYYEHILRIKPLTYPEAMENGISGHSMMEIVFKAMLEGKDYDACVEELNPFVSELIATNPARLKVYRHVLAFLAYVFQQGWKPVYVEENMLAPVAEHEFAFTPDIIFEWTSGPKRGKQFVLDFKFTGQYWNDRQINMFQQLPKYIIYSNRLREGNMRHAGVVMLNTRAADSATGDRLFMVKWLTITPEKLRRIEEENEILIRRVAFAKLHYEPVHYLRTVDSHACMMCFFADDLCPADLEGRDTKRIIERNYERNTYFDDNYEKENNGQKDAGSPGLSSS